MHCAPARVPGASARTMAASPFNTTFLEGTAVAISDEIQVRRGTDGSEQGTVQHRLALLMRIESCIP